MISEITVLKAFFTAQDQIRTVTSLPSDLAAVVPVRQILPAGGGTIGRAMRLPRVALHHFASAGTNADQSAARSLATSDYDLMLYKLAGRTFAGGTVSAVEVVTLPAEVSYANPALCRYVSIYQLSLRDANPSLIFP